jgi:hypothetical protein
MRRRAGFASFLVILSIAVTAIWLVGSCGRRSEEAKRPMTATSWRDSLKVRLELRERGYASGEPIEMKLVVSNTTDRRIKITFPTAQRFDFIVKKDRVPVWQWSGERMFAQVLGRHAIEAKGFVAYEFTWDQKLPDGSWARLGRYTVQGILKSMPEIASTEKEFGIVD